MYLAITDGTTTVVLSGTSPVNGCTYFPATAQMSDGAWQDVAETAEVVLQGTAANIRTTINNVERLLEQAAQRQQGILQPRVYINYKPVDGDAASFRSEVIEGRVVWSDNPGLRRLGETTPTVQVGVVWLRRPWWEGAEVELSISSNGVAAGTGGKAIDNGTANWVQIAAAQVTGVLPAPVKVKLQNTTGSAAEYTRIFMATNAFSDPANFAHIIEAEDAAEGGTPAADATCSGGDKLNITINTGATDTVSFTLAAALLQDTQGRWFRVLSRWDGLSGPCTIQLQLKDSTGATTLWAGESIVVTALYTALLDLGTVPLPPGGYAATYGALQLVLNMRGPLVGSLDFLQLTPTDSYRYVEMYGAAVADDDYVVDDGIEGITYVDDGTAYIPIASPRGQPLMLYPNRLQRVYFLHQVDYATPAAPVANASAVQLYYRPRRLTA